MREQIIARLLTVCKVRGVAVVVRNQAEISDTNLPAVLIFDGDEIADPSDPLPRPANAPRRVAMTPEIRVILGTVAESVGTDLNALRDKILKAVLTDATLLGLTADDRGIRYDGCATQLKIGRSMQGDMLMSFTFAYYLKPWNL